MNTYIKFIIFSFLKAFAYVIAIFFSLVIILNVLTEIEFFNDIEVKFYFPIYLAFLNSLSLIFEMFPFIFLLTTQIFFINIFNENQFEIFKYSGLKNLSLIKILTLNSFFIGLLIIIFFYTISSNFKSLYLEIKNKFSQDQKYLAVITNNGLWIKDTVENQNFIIHASEIDRNYLRNTFISQFSNKNETVRHIQSEKIDITKNEWLILNPNIYQDNIVRSEKSLKLNLNFNYEKIQSLFSNLSSLSILKLYELKKNYKSLNYSTTEVDLQINKILSYPIYLMLMTILGSVIMLKIKKYRGNVIKISFGLFISVIIYYINNFFNVMGQSEKLPIIISIWLPLIILFLFNVFFSFKVNAK